MLESKPDSSGVVWRLFLFWLHPGTIPISSSTSECLYSLPSAFPGPLGYQHSSMHIFLLVLSRSI